MSRENGKNYEKEIKILCIQINIIKCWIYNIRWLKFMHQKYNITIIVRYLIIFGTYLLSSISKLIIICQLASQSGWLQFSWCKLIYRVHSNQSNKAWPRVNRTRPTPKLAVRFSYMSTANHQFIFPKCKTWKLFWLITLYLIHRNDLFKRTASRNK